MTAAHALARLTQTVLQLGKSGTAATLEISAAPTIGTAIYLTHADSEGILQTQTIAAEQHALLAAERRLRRDFKQHFQQAA